MLVSTSPIPNNYVFDTNVVTRFARINRLDLLLHLSVGHVYITPAIQRELETGLNNGVKYLIDVIQWIHTGRLPVLSLTQIDRQFMRALPSKLGDGEAQAIALCRRVNFTFVSHDSRAIDYCKHEGIKSIRLTNLVKKLQKAGLLAEDEIQIMFS
jgi:predicted nucleic acid-binding protein